MTRLISGTSATHEEATVTAIKQTVTIQPGGRVEVVSDELPEGRQAEVIILVDHTAEPPIEARRDVEGSKPEERDREYPTADFIEPTKYDWSIDKFIAEQAVREYLRDSHANH
jgi:hypothetical protein